MHCESLVVAAVAVVCPRALEVGRSVSHRTTQFVVIALMNGRNSSVVFVLTGVMHV
jgi:hypothetical protein